MADATNLEKKYLYQVYRSGIFKGVLQNVKSEFSLQQDLNTAGATLQVVVADTADQQFDAPDPILTENDLPITDELGQTLYTERQPDRVGNANSKALIRNNNSIYVYEISPNYPNGKLVFSGWISRWRASFGGSELITITCLSNGTELDNNIISTGESKNVTQESDDTSTLSCKVDFGKFDYNYDLLQSFIPASSITFSALSVELTTTSDGRLSFLLMRQVGASPDPTGVDVLVAYGSAIIPLTSVKTAYKINSDVNVAIDPSNTYYFRIYDATTAYGHEFLLYAHSSNVYANGQAYKYTYDPSALGDFQYHVQNTIPLYDIYFDVWSSTGSTQGVYSSQDPTAILRSLVDNYVSNGGIVNYASGSTVLTGLSRSYTFKVNTTLEGIQKCLQLAPYDWYWYVDPATNVIYFKEASTSADHKMIYGRHIQSLDVEASVEEVKNVVYFTGGDVGSNVYLYQTQTDATALAANNARVGLARISDNRVTNSATATALMQNFINTNKNENYQSSITINADTYDINLFKLGDVIGFAGFGNFVDNLLLQIVHKEQHPDYVVLGLGRIPQRASAKVEDIQRALDDVETIYNPSAPS